MSAIAVIAAADEEDPDENPTRLIGSPPFERLDDQTVAERPVAQHFRDECLVGVRRGIDLGRKTIDGRRAEGRQGGEADGHADHSRHRDRR